MSQKVCYITDIEGQWPYLDRWVQRSRGVYWQTRKTTSMLLPHRKDVELASMQLELKNGYSLVCGGDIGDKGTETLRCYEVLVDLKNRYPDRVDLLLGNRDVNKMRFTSELQDREFLSADDLPPGPYWVSEKDRISARQYLEAMARNTLNITAGKVTEEHITRLNTRINRLKWMLTHTMGSQGDFERRRIELSKMKGTSSVDEVSNDDVLDSYLTSVQPGGVIHAYLQLAVMCVIRGSTLYVHGGICGNSLNDSKSVFTSDGLPCSETIALTEWAAALNAWSKQEIASWERNPHWNSDRSDRGGHSLLDYVVPSNRMSVIMSRHLDAQGMPFLVQKSVLEYLYQNGISRVAAGHSPHGNCPTVIRQFLDVQGHCFPWIFDFIMADTSFSDISAMDNRGLAVSEIVLDEDGYEVHGVLETGEDIAYNNHDQKIGRQLSDEYWIKAKMKSTDAYLCVLVENGRKYTYRQIGTQEIDEIGIKSP